MRRFLKWLVRLLVVGVVAVAALFVWFVLMPANSIPALEPVDEYVWLDQGWGTGQNAALRQRYYYTAQGTSMPQGVSSAALRYDWFVNLELPLTTERFASPEHMRRYRFIVDPAPSEANPHQLPVGFTRHFDAHIGEYVLDITCAACHTGEIHYTKDGKTRAMRIDGGPAMHAFTDMTRGNFAPELLASLIDTANIPWKFDRFAKKVLGAGYPDAKPQLRAAMRSTIWAMLGSGQNNPFRRLYPVKEGFGRTDALGRIGNTAFGDHLSSVNYQDGDAPVSYPYLWNIWKFDWVQYNGSVSQPLARNVGEALGVGAVTPLISAVRGPIPESERYRSSVDIPGLLRIEHTLHQLRPPQWPAEIFGPVDQAKVARGQALFKQRCEECHGPHVAEENRQKANAPLKPSHELEWRMEVIPLEHIGTDPAAANGFMKRRYDLSATGITNKDIDAALRPLFTRQLLRDVQFRMREILRLSPLNPNVTGTDTPKGWGVLNDLAHDYPDPDAAPNPTIPTDLFVRIDTAVQMLTPAPEKLPDADWRPADPLDCAFECHVINLFWDVREGGKNIDRILASLDVKSLTEGIGLNLVGILIKNRYYADNGIDYATQQCIEGFGTLDLPQQIAGYKPRPLEGTWATAPFLHNGSVPTLYQMLLPPAKRDTKFFVGLREYDPLHVGFITAPKDDDNDGGFWLDTSIPGNHNTGHAFSADAATWAKHLENPKANPLPHGVIGPEFTDEERYDIIEYLKVHRDLPETPPNYLPPECKLNGKIL